MFSVLKEIIVIELLVHFFNFHPFLFILEREDHFNIFHKQCISVFVPNRPDAG